LIEVSKKLFLVILFSLFVFPQKTFAHLYINEFHSFSTDSDWVEIYNSSEEPVDLSNYILRDSTESNKLDLSGTIEGKSFAIFDWSNKLNKTDDTIKLLLKADSSQIDQIIYGSQELQAPVENQTGGRNPDGSSTLVIFSSSTKGTSNNSSSLAPTSTSTPTPTSKPTHSPVPTKTPKPTPTTKSSSPTPVKSNSPTQSLKAATVKSEDKKDLIPTSILGEATESSISEIPQEEKSEEVKTLGESQTNWPMIIIFSASIILIICGILAFFIIKRKGISDEGI
jgi:hypothetical protein